MLGYIYSIYYKFLLSKYTIIYIKVIELLKKYLNKLKVNLKVFIINNYTKLKEELSTV